MKSEAPHFQGHFLSCKEAYLKILRAKLPVKNICIANHMILTGGFGDDAGAVLQSPFDADLQHNHHVNSEYLGNSHSASHRRKIKKADVCKPARGLAE